MASSRPFIRAILIDLSGTLHIGSSPTPNAVDALKRLRSAEISFRFCSNTSKESTAELCNRLRKIGFDISSEGASQEMWTSLAAVKRLVDERGLKRCVDFAFVLSPRIAVDTHP
jgi:ribonucleotide monophosphatase NagD (HAD superfamily)